MGEGCVIDSYGRTSRKQDVVFYERDICPVFSINRTPQTTYYPCEGVIGVGEVKSSLDGSSLHDAFQKLDGHTICWGKIGKGKRREIVQSKDGHYSLREYVDGPEGWQVLWSAETATHVGGSDTTDPFRLLVRWIRQGAELGRTSDVRAFDRYFEERSTGEGDPVWCVPRLRTQQHRVKT